ncbi:ArsC family reductase [Methylophaga pinxianii]|uniref:ArsC family reductase n=1 Tax=Methylophaga pinxianii TaxID=2881052 RepID=UPI001CF165CE|nr:ArsC family reductase [Methylophaga pinxianii]MCB2428406.1 ArsC family reductase [Methylophaga pinxianii]UPH45342.1 ArsC family reductase [Methylophaga pinxianii]
MKLFGIKNCDTVKKARRWLDEHQVSYQFHDFRTDGLDQATIEQWLNYVSWEQLINKRGTTWRKLEDPRKDQLDISAAIELMVTHPTLIKRPVIEDKSGVSIGFNESDFQVRYAK